ncbi:MAG: substrate-binding domain-containing protein [Candidatus Hydrogenedens sp.]|nr:substrate-binding domain-containing protein [Candidatus Hydrogenedens sp.]
MFKRMLSLAAVCLLAACSNSAPPQGQAQPGVPRVALVMKSLANEFFKTMEDSARAYAGEHADKFTLVANGIKNEEDVAGQIALVEQMIVQQVDAIVIAPANSEALVWVLKRAADAGIVVVNIDNKLSDDAMAKEGVQIPFIGPDNRAGARLAGEHVAASLQAGDTAAIIGGIPSAFNAIQRAQGFQDALDAAGIQVVATQAGNWEMAKANQVASGLINEHPDLDAILCANDNMALGAVAALRDAGKEGQVLVCGYDNIGAVRDLVKAGTVDCTVEQHGDQLAIYGIDYALDILASGGQPADKETPVELVTAESLGG